MLAQNGVASLSALTLHPHHHHHGINRSGQLLGVSRLQKTLCKSRARVTCAAEDSKEDAARKALEQAFQGKKSVAKKWEEEIRNRELAGGDGGISGDAWGGSGGDGDRREGPGQNEPWDWEEAGQVFMATFSLVLLYCLITYGPKQTYVFTVNVFRYVWQGFRVRKIPDNYDIPLEGDPMPDAPAVSEPRKRERWRKRSNPAGA